MHGCCCARVSADNTRLVLEGQKLLIHFFFWMTSGASQQYWEHEMQQGQPKLGCRVSASPYSQPAMVGNSSTTASKTDEERKST